MYTVEPQHGAGPYTGARAQLRGARARLRRRGRPLRVRGPRRDVVERRARCSERAAGTPIRVASKSVRCRPLLASILDEPGFRGLMTFTLPESLWLHEHGFDDLLLAYPTAHRGALAELGRLESERPPILMVDSVAHLDLIESAVGPRRAAGEGLHRPRRELVAARRPPEDRSEALADPHARAGARAGARDREAARAGAGGPDGLRGPHRGSRRQPAREAGAGTADPPDQAPLGERDRGAPRRRGGGRPARWRRFRS